MSLAGPAGITRCLIQADETNVSAAAVESYQFADYSRQDRWFFHLAHLAREDLETDGDT